MDPALLKAREAFKRRALDNPVVEKRVKKPESESGNSKTKVAKKLKDDISKPRKGNELRLVGACICYCSFVIRKYMDVFAANLCVYHKNVQA